MFCFNKKMHIDFLRNQQIFKDEHSAFSSDLDTCDAFLHRIAKPSSQGEKTIRNARKVAEAPAILCRSQISLATEFRTLQFECIN